MKNDDLNLIQLEAIAGALDDLLPSVTFVGGSTTVLLVDEAARHGVRHTQDVDVIIDVATLAAYHDFSQKLRNLGFKEDTEGPVCRWLIKTDFGLVKLDVMPIDEAIIGFSNHWYKAAIEHAIKVKLPSSIEIQVVSPTYFIATKFEAFAGRGKGDYFSHDLEDIIFVMENRNRLIFELMDCTDDLKQYFSNEAAKLLNDDFLNVLPGLLNNPDSVNMIINNLKIMQSWTKAD